MQRPTSPEVIGRAHAILRAIPKIKNISWRKLLMKLCTLALMIVSGILFLSSCSKPANETANNAPAASPTSKPTVDEFAIARATFKKDCSVCHGEDGTGGLKTVEGKKLKVPNFREGHALKHPDEDFVKQITNGGDGMPKFKDKLTPQQINDLVRFIRREFQGR
jgi:cytochrome c553